MFPVEIIEILITHSQGTDIINFRLVCKTWNSIVNRLSKDTNLWQIKCENEIPIHFRKSILNKLYPNIKWFEFIKSKKNNLIWARIYRSWITWHKIKETRTLIDQFEPFFIRLPNVKITCVAVSENILAVGCSEGFIAFYNVENSTQEPFFIADQMACVSNVQFFHSDAILIAISTSDMDHVMVWEIQSETTPGEKQPGRFISATNGYVCIASKHQLRILSKDKRKIYQFSELNGTIAALVADGDEACLLTDLGMFIKVKLDGPNVEYVCEYVTPPVERVCKYYLFGPWVALCITRDGYLGISLNSGSWIMYEILSKLHGTPTCVFLYSNLLVLGLDSGSVHMYYVSNIESLTSWNFESGNSAAIVVDNEAIVALDIMERPNKQYLIASTAEKVKMIDIKYFE